MEDSILAYTMGGCRHPCRSVGECSMAGRLSPMMGDAAWETRVSGPDFSTMARAYVPRETGKDGTVEGAENRPLPMEKAEILAVTRAETDPGSPYCNVAAVLRSPGGGYRSGLLQAMREEGRRLEYTPHDGTVDIMVACSVECPSPCQSTRNCRLYQFMDSRIREIEKRTRGKDFTSFSMCEGRPEPGSMLESRATAYGFNDEGGSTFLNLVKLRGDERPYCVLMLGLHGEDREERKIAAALRGALDAEGGRFGAKKLV